MKRSRGLSWILAAVVGVFIILATSLSLAELPGYSIRLHHSRSAFLEWFSQGFVSFQPGEEEEDQYRDDDDPEVKSTTVDENINAELPGESESKLKKNSPPAGDSESSASVEKSVEQSETRRCDVYSGSWVQDESYPLFKPSVCPFTDVSFRCVENGRNDTGFLKWRWQPSQCNLPRFNSTRMLRKLRGKRLAFVGDSLGRNQWESLVCMLYQGVSNQSNVYETRRQQVGKSKRSFSIIFTDYNVRVDYYRSHYLVLENRKPPGLRRKIGCSLTLDHLEKGAPRWRTADILIFNSGHWWTHTKVKSGKCYFIQGSNYTTKMDVLSAYEQSLRTWASWVDNTASRKRVFFRGFAPSHFSGGSWDTGGTCDKHKQPLEDESQFGEFPEKVAMVEKVLREMKTPVTFLNVTYLSLFRKDGHIANWGRPRGDHRQDCSHWCLPGVPDTWNHLLYASLLQQ